jgi:ribosomal protein S4E
MTKFRLFNRRYHHYDFNPNLWTIKWDNSGFFVVPVHPSSCFIEYSVGINTDTDHKSLFAGDVIKAKSKNKTIEAVVVFSEQDGVFAFDGINKHPFQSLSSISIIGNANLDTFFKEPLASAIKKYNDYLLY